MKQELGGGQEDAEVYASRQGEGMYESSHPLH